MKCAIHDCLRKVVSKFLCSNHYQKLRLHGTTYGPSKQDRAESYQTSESYRRRIGQLYSERRQKNKILWVSKLGGKCVDCSTSDIRVLTFDHEDPSSKEHAISSLMLKQNPEHPTLVDEMTKCVLRCANCHLIKSVERGEVGRRRVYV